jgi:hypothetical protein
MSNKPSAPSYELLFPPEPKARPPEVDLGPIGHSERSNIRRGRRKILRVYSPALKTVTPL